MSGRQASSWRPLPGVEVPGIPGLLVSTDFTPQSYTIHLTDLANLWTESLDKKPVIMRGLKEDTSIDPTDGPDQIRKLLDLVRAAFDPSAPEHGDTTLALSKASGSTETEGANDLEIHVTVVLPRPLRPLKWPIYLRKQPQSAIATELVLPLIHSQRAYAREVDELITAVREKDGVITKLVDKLEATGTGLEHVFTALSGRRKVTRATAEERIRGLAPFKECEFRKHAETVERGGDGDDVPALLDSVFGGGAGLPSGSALDIGESPALNDWWTKFGKGKSAALVSRAKNRESAASSKGESQPVAPAAAPAAAPKPDGGDDDETQSEDDGDDDFQVQATPPGRRQPGSTRTAEGQDKDEDEEFEVQATPPSRKRDRHGRAARVLDDDDDDEISGGEEAEIPDSLPSAAAKETTISKANSKRLGAIGGKSKQPSTRKKTPPPPKRPSPTPSPPRTRAHPAPAKGGDDDSATASEPDDHDEDAMDTSPPPPPPKPSSQPARRGGGIGRIGGRRAPVAKEATPEPPRGSSPGAASSQQTPRRRLGVIGKKAPDSAERGRGRTRSPAGDGGEGEGVEEGQEQEEEKRETSRERADRKRAELKRELDKKAHAAPAKKKRKF